MGIQQSSRPTDAEVSAEQVKGADTTVKADPTASTKFADLARRHAALAPQFGTGKK